MNLQNRNWGCRIHEFTIGGVKAVSLENERLRLGVLTGLGGQIFEFLHKPSDTDFMYRDANGLRLLSGPITSREEKQGKFYDYFTGGWFELFPNAGRSCRHREADLGMHGEVMTLDWDMAILENTPERAAIRMSTHAIRTPFAIEKTLVLERNSSVVRISERIHNTGRTPAEYTWGHHITMGQAFLNEHCVISVPDCRVSKWEQYDSPASRLLPECEGAFREMPGRNGGTVDLSRMPACGAGTEEMLFLEDVKEHWFGVTDTRKGVGFAVAWDGTEFPGLWLWQECNSNMDFPDYGRCYGMSLEPMTTNTPILAEAVKDGTCGVLAAGESRETWLVAAAYEDARTVARVDRDGGVRFR